MRFSRTLKVEHGLTYLTIIPLIDVVLLLLIFYILSLGLTTPFSLKTTILKTITSKSIKEENTVIVVSRENIIYVDGKLTTLNELQNILENSPNKKRPVFIKADQRISFSRIIDIWNLCRNAGIEFVNIATAVDN